MKREKLYNKRISLGLSQKDVAEKVGINRSHYGFIENGQRNPSYTVANRISEFFGMPIKDLFPGLIFFGSRCYAQKQEEAYNTQAS